MKSDLPELENNEAILLMYLADELGTEDRAEVELMLAGDAVLRAEMESLRQMREMLWKGLEKLDAVTRPAISQPRAVRSVSGLVRQWTEGRRPPAPVAIEQNHRSFAWRRWSMAAAAMLLVGSYIWFAYHPTRPTEPPIQAVDLPPQEKLALLANSLDDPSNEDSLNAHVAEVAAIIPRAPDAGLPIDGNNNKGNSDSN